MLILLEAYKLGEENHLHPDREAAGKTIIQLTGNSYSKPLTAL